ATMRWAACRRTSSMLRTARGGGSFEPSRATSGLGFTVSSGAGFGAAAVGGTGFDTSPGPRSEEPVQPATASNRAAEGAATRPHERPANVSMKRTIDLLGKLTRNA